mmetsp:Transcript_11304/g.24858  ORF Transcript_11304/g.24858 Transcript_11304/m.24858 type:complete len:246 (+) Transcript_11304:2256-2993(+)
MFCCWRCCSMARRRIAARLMPSSCGRLDTSMGASGCTSKFIPWHSTDCEYWRYNFTPNSAMPSIPNNGVSSDNPATSPFCTASSYRSPMARFSTSVALACAFSASLPASSFARSVAFNPSLPSKMELTSATALAASAYLRPINESPPRTHPSRIDNACSKSMASASNCWRWCSSVRISEEAADPPEAILERLDRMDSVASVACVRGWEGADLWRVRDGVSFEGVFSGSFSFVESASSSLLSIDDD